MSLAARPAAARAPRVVPGARSGQRLSVFLGQVQTGFLERRGPGRYRFSYAPGSEAAEPGSGAILSAEGWHQPVIDRIAELSQERAAQLGSG